MRQKINRREADLFPGFARAGESFSMLKQHASNRSYASHQGASCKFALTRRRQPLANSDRLSLERAEHILQLGELAGTVAPGDGVVDRFRRRRHRFDQLQTLGRDRHDAAAADRLSPPAVRSDDAPPGRAQSAKGSGPAGKATCASSVTSMASIEASARRIRHCCSVRPWLRSEGRKCRITASRARSNDIGSERENSRIGHPPDNGCACRFRTGGCRAIFSAPLSIVPPSAAADRCTMRVCAATKFNSV